MNPETVVVSLGTDAVAAVAGEKGVVVIDAGISNSLTAKYRKIVESELGRHDFAYLINTHSHPDHTGGNQVFSDAVIIGQENCIEEMKNYWRDPAGIKARLLKIAVQYEGKLASIKPGDDEWEETNCQRIRYRHAYNDILNGRIVTPPDSVFEDSLTISLGDISLNLIYFGKAHTASDIIIYIPEMKLLFTGDLFFTGGRPSFVEKNNYNRSRRAGVLKWIKARLNQVDMVIGGHGDIMSRDDLKSFYDIIEKRGANSD